jgi:hypothetical protein
MDPTGECAIGRAGFCALRLAQRLLDPVPAGNCKLQTLRRYYCLSERGAHTALGDVGTVADLLATVLRPIAEQRGLATWEQLAAYAAEEWYPSRIAFGKHRGRSIAERCVASSRRFQATEKREAGYAAERRLPETRRRGNDGKRRSATHGGLRKTGA